MSNDLMTLDPAQLKREITSALSAAQCQQLDILEYRISDHRSKLATSMLEIGRCLVEAKEAHLVDHGHWQDWVQLHTGLNPRSAQRLMQAAREVPNTSTLTHLAMSKIFPLLALPADEREGFAQEVGADQLSVRQLEEAIRARKEAEEAANAMRAELHKVNGQLSRNISELDAISMHARKQQQEINRLRANPQVVERTVEVTPPDYEAMCARAQAADANVAEAYRVADEQEARAKAAEAELAQLRMGQEPRVSDGQAFADACAAFQVVLTRYGAMDSAELMQLPRAELAAMQMWAASTSTMLARLVTALSASPIVLDAEVFGDV